MQFACNPPEKRAEKRTGRQEKLLSACIGGRNLRVPRLYDTFRCSCNTRDFTTDYECNLQLSKSPKLLEPKLSRRVRSRTSYFKHFQLHVGSGVFNIETRSTLLLAFSNFSARYLKSYSSHNVAISRGLPSSGYQSISSRDIEKKGENPGCGSSNIRGTLSGQDLSSDP